MAARGAKLSFVNEVVGVLNEMGTAPHAPSGDLSSAAQEACLERIRAAVDDFGAPDHGLSPARALTELCKTSSAYQLEAVSASR